MAIHTLEQLLYHEMEDLYDAEQQLVRALPFMAECATDIDLQRALEAHLEVTETQVRRLEVAFRTLNRQAKPEHYKAMQGLIDEVNETLGEDMPPDIMDVALIAGGARIEHYEISGYITAVILASATGHDDVADLLRVSLEEEMAAADDLEASAEAMSTVAVGGRD